MKGPPVLPRPMAADRVPARRLGVAVLLAAAGLVLAVALAIPAVLVPLAPLGRFLASTVLSELAFAVVALAFVWRTGVGLEYLRLSRLDGRAGRLVVAGTVGMFVYRLASLLAIQALGLPVAGNAVTEFPGLDVATIVLLLIPISIVVVGPAEELLFRGVIQRHLEGGFATPWAIVLTGVLFSLVHLPTTYLADPNPTAVVVALGVLFGLSLVLSWLYVRSENLLVPMLAHGGYDAAIFALAYYVLEVAKLPTAVGPT